METNPRPRAILASIVFLLYSALGFSQPHIALWLDQGDGDIQFYNCGSYFASIVPYVGNGAVLSSESTWIIRNLGNENLIITNPISFAEGAPASFEITKLPDNVVPPNGETTFKLKYTVPDITSLSVQNAFLEIFTNDPTSESCGLLLGGSMGINSLCYCFCNEDQELEQICPKEVTGFKAGILVDIEFCQSANGSACASMALGDPCACKNLNISGPRPLFEDTLTVTAGAGVMFTLTDNVTSDTYSFLDVNGDPIPKGTVIGFTNAKGLLHYPFYREAVTAVKIRVNGVEFISSELCPEAVACEPSLLPPPPTEMVPTLSEWSLVLLTLLLMIVGLLKVQADQKGLIVYRNK